MSALTKLFVVLLIVCSLLLTAATVVFVNRTEEFNRSAMAWEETAKRATLKQQAAEADANAARMREQQMASDGNKAVADLQGRIATLTQGIEAKDVEINGLKTQGAVVSAQMDALTTAVKAAQANQDSLGAQNKGLVAELDQLRTRGAELVGTNTDLTKRVEEAERERRWYNEQLNQLKVELARAQNLLAENRITSNSKPKGPQTTNLPDLKGVIRSVKESDGQTYATISLGSADKVEKGMEFNVVDQVNSQFLGKIVIETVDANASFGRLEGPRVHETKPDHLVLSRL